MNTLMHNCVAVITYGGLKFGKLRHTFVNVQMHVFILYIIHALYNKISNQVYFFYYKTKIAHFLSQTIHNTFLKRFKNKYTD